MAKVSQSTLKPGEYKVCHTCRAIFLNDGRYAKCPSCHKVLDKTITLPDAKYDGYDVVN